MAEEIKTTRIEKLNIPFRIPRGYNQIKIDQ